MTKPIIVTGTDTEIGKTIFSAGLTAALGAEYWKPVQSGLDAETDSDVVARLSGRPTLPEAYRLRLPASPHLSAEAESLTIDADKLTFPGRPGPLVIEGAGGVMVPLNRKTLFIDLFETWRAPVILCARPFLGTINHTLLSIEALKQREIVIAGVVFIGTAEPEVEQTIVDFGGVSCLGSLPILEELTPSSLLRAFNKAIDLGPIKKALAI
jgi:dethiobiotin synthetase